MLFLVFPASSALDLSRGPTVVSLYLLPSLNARLLPQLQKLPASARVLSVEHRMADIAPDQQVTVDTEDGEYKILAFSGPGAASPFLRRSDY